MLGSFQWSNHWVLGSMGDHWMAGPSDTEAFKCGDHWVLGTLLVLTPLGAFNSPYSVTLGALQDFAYAATGAQGIR